MRFLLTVAGVSGLAIAVTSATKQQARHTLNGVDIRITNAQQVGFITEGDLEELLFRRRHLQPQTMALAGTDVRRLERIARSNPWIQSAQVYIDQQRVLHIQATQRVPYVRLFETSGESYYLDTALKQLPLSPNYTHYAPVVTGVPHLLDSNGQKRMQAQIVYVVRKLSANPFWRQGVEEIVVRDEGDFELIPVLGTHRVILGDTSAFDAKLNTLFLFYRNVLNRIGWDRYTVLDARYNGQVVASPSLPWKPPVDRALSNMNWVKTIVAEEIPDTMTPLLKARAEARKPEPLQPAPVAKAGTSKTVTASPKAKIPPATSGTPQGKKAPPKSATAAKSTPATRKSN
jgi:cell division protein FtsQ